MDLVKFTIRLANGQTATRYATTDQDVDAIEQIYLRIVPGAVLALRTVVARDIGPKRAAWLHQSQMIDAYGATLRKKKWDRACGHYNAHRGRT